MYYRYYYLYFLFILFGLPFLKKLIQPKSITNIHRFESKYLLNLLSRLVPIKGEVAGYG